MTKWKYDSPEWKYDPIRTQIREALKEVEQVRSALMALERIVPSLESYRKEALSRSTPLKGSTGKDTIGESVSKGLVQGVAQGMARESTMSVQNAALRFAEVELSRLKGWMESLCESELGLIAILSGNFNSRMFVAQRTVFLGQEAQKWERRRMIMKI